MPTLVIDAPTMEVVLREAQDFDAVLQLNVGEAYCFTSREADEIRPGRQVIVLDKTKHRRADGTLKGLESVEHARACSKGRSRYDVHLDGLVEVDFDAPLPPLSLKPKRCKDGSLYLNRCGVALLR